MLDSCWNDLKYSIVKFIPIIIATGIILLLINYIVPGGINLEKGVDKGIVNRCGSSDWGDFEGEYPLIWINTDNGKFVYWFKYAPEINNTLIQGNYYEFEYGYEYMPSGCTAGEGNWVRTLSRIRDKDRNIVWGDWWIW